jgi:cysteine desulfurase
VAALCGGQASEVVFTSGATEALNLALVPHAGAGRLLVSGGEHPAVLEGHRFEPAAVERIPLDGDGVVDLAALRAALARPGAAPPLLALQLANNETGVLQPVAAAAAAVHAAGGTVVVDAVQAAGRIAIDMAALGADMLVLSSHKLGGPMGAGALLRAPNAGSLPPLVRGGGQERGLRAGTENVAAIAGFAAAAAMVAQAWPGEADRLDRLRRRLEAGLAAIDDHTVIFGRAAPRLPNTTAFAVRDVAAEAALIAFDLAGISVSTGSACSSGRVKTSHVLESMGVTPDLRKGMIRMSLGWTTEEADIDRALAVWSRLRHELPVRRAA